jgi:hypothetical protein
MLNKENHLQEASVNLIPELSKNKKSTNTGKPVLTLTLN